MGSLSLYLKAGDKLGLLWKFSEEGGNIWNGAESVTIPKYSNYENFTFIFEGMIKPKYCLDQIGKTNL
jgi:hypothetical protein